MKIVQCIFIAAGISLFALPAHAGFQWVSPAEPAPPPVNTMPNVPSYSSPGPVEVPGSLAPAPSMPVTKSPASSGMSVTPLAGEDPAIISPIVIEGQPFSSGNASNALPVVPGTGTPSSIGMPAAPSSPDSIVEGFANNVPLAVALRQVLPPGYGFSIDQDVDLGTLVSFQGGRPWRETLRTMIEPVGLAVREQNQMIAISRLGGVTMASSTPMDGTPALQPAAAVLAPTSITPSVSVPENPGPRPLWTQPASKLPKPAPPLPPVTSSRMSASSVVDTWTGARGETLHHVLENWSRRSGAEFEWLAEYDYPLQASIAYTGTFEEAVRSLLSGFEEAHPQPVARLHANPAIGQMVLVIETRGNSYAD
ncbi:MAG: TcpQ domain-containing protein [Bdellovibrionales bacterium]